MIIVLLLQSSLHVAGGSTSWGTGVAGTNGGGGGGSSNGNGNGEVGVEIGVGTSSSWECISLDGQRIPHGENFVPGPDYCTVCKCEEGIARFCRAVLCQPPQDCKSFRVGKTCCDFICLDDILPKVPDGNNGTTTTDLGLRMVASAITAILSLALLLFLIHRLRQRRLRAHQQYYEDQLDSPGGGAGADVCHNNGCCHNAAYCSANDHVDLFFEGHTPPYALWKPPSFYFNYEDNPPPYSEVVGSSSYHQSSSHGPLTVQLPRESSSDHAPIGIASQASAVAGMAQAASRLGTLERRDTVIRSDQVYEDDDESINIFPNEPAPPYSTLLPSNHSRGPPQSPSQRSSRSHYTSITQDTQIMPQSSAQRSPRSRYTLTTQDMPQSPAERRSPTVQYIQSAANTEMTPTHENYTDYIQGSPTHNGHIIQSDDIQTTHSSPVYSKQDKIPHSFNDLNMPTAADICAETENNTDINEELGAVGGMRLNNKRPCLSDTCSVSNMNGAIIKKHSNSDTVGSSDSENITHNDSSDSHSASQITSVRQRVKSITEKQQQQQQQQQQLHQMSTLEEFRVRLTQDLSDSSLSSTTQPTTRTLSTSSSDDTSIDTYSH